MRTAGEESLLSGPAVGQVMPELPDWMNSVKKKMLETLLLCALMPDDAGLAAAGMQLPTDLSVR